MMSRRHLLLGYSVLVASIYALLVYGLFSEDYVSSETVLLQEDSNEISDTLYWLQAGVFKEESSYITLKNQLVESGFEVYCIPKGELMVVVVEPETSHETLNQHMEAAEKNGFEVIEKQGVLNDELHQMISEGKMSEVLEVLMNS